MFGEMPFILTAAAVATLPSVNLVFTTPKFAFEQVYFHAEWREKFITEVRLFSKTSLPTRIRFDWQIESSNLRFSFCHREAANG